MEASSQVHMPCAIIAISYHFFHSSDGFSTKLTMFLLLKLRSSNTYLGIIYGILATLEHCMTPISPYKRTIPKLHKTPWRLIWKSWWKYYSLHLWHMEEHEHWTCFTSRLITCKVMTLLNMFIVSKKSNSYMTKLPFVIEEMHDKNKSANTSPWQLKVKKCSASITWHKGWKHKPFLGHLDNPQQKIMSKLLHWWKF
jgi:hypothetical protein